MPITNLPESINVIYDRMRSDIQANLPGLNPFLKNSLFDSQTRAEAIQFFDLYKQVETGLLQRFIQFATADNLELLLAPFRVTRNPASQASGFITASGVDSSVVPIGTLLANENGDIYETQATETVLDQTLSVTLTRSGSTVTATTPSNHNLASGILVNHSGAVETEYNGPAIVLVTALNEYTYQITGTPTTPATGTILADFTTASIEVLSQAFGQSTNVGNGGQFNFTTPIAGVDVPAFVQFGEIGGGSDSETDEDFRARGLDRIQNPIANFNPSQIVFQAKLVPGNTRVFVFRITPEIGQVTVYFTRDNDATPIPSASEIADTREKIVEIQPADMADADLFVLAPTPVIVDFTFTSISPDTPTMREAILANLQQFFSESTDVGVNVTEIAYECAIQDTVDLENAQKLQSFVLSSPSGDIVISTGELAILGTVSYL